MMMPMHAPPQSESFLEVSPFLADGGGIGGGGSGLPVRIPRTLVWFDEQDSALYIASVRLRMRLPACVTYESNVYVGFSTAAQLLAVCQRLLREHLFPEFFHHRKPLVSWSLLHSLSSRPPVEISQISVSLEGDQKYQFGGGVVVDGETPLDDGFSSFVNARVSLAATSGRRIGQPPWLAHVYIDLKLNTPASRERGAQLLQLQQRRPAGAPI